MESNHDTYLTISSVSEGLYKDKGSKFISKAFPVESEEHIREVLTGIKKQYHDARHHCYAWILGHDQSNYRINDDGEPSGTAGRPIYGQLLSAGVTNVLVVVIRYFGGTKLGVRGLINAYKGAAQEALDQAVMVQRVRVKRIKALFDYPSMNEVMKIIKDYNLEITNHTYEQSSVVLIFSVRLTFEKEVVSRLRSVSNLTINTL